MGSKEPLSKETPAQAERDNDGQRQEAVTSELSDLKAVLRALSENRNH